MQRKILLLPILLIFFSLPSSVLAAGLVDQVPTAFETVFGKKPTATELAYWKQRVTSGEKKTYDALVGAMGYQKANPPKTSVSGKTTVAVKTDNKQKMIVETLPLFIKIFGKNPTNTEKAWWRARISCNELKNFTDLENSMKFHKSKGKTKGNDTICGGTFGSGSSSSAISGVITRRLDGVSDHPEGEDIRVGIWHTDGSAIILTANTGFYIRTDQGETIATLGKDDQVKVSWSNGKYHIRAEGISDDSNDAVRIMPVTGGGIVQIVNYSDPSKTYPGKNYNRFRGFVEVHKCTTCNELWAVNQLRLELYLRGLAETSGEGPDEYIKALGIAARTYALFHKVVTGGRNTAKGYDITNTADDQLYRGYEYEIIAPRIASILGKVKGIVATNSEGDIPISTVYFSDSDGRTRSAKEAWHTERFPYLQHSVKDPYHQSKSCLGHCVGMSAQGAYGFAKAEGWDYKKILNYYYKDIKLVKAY